MSYKRLFYNWLQEENIYGLFFVNVARERLVTYKSNSGKKKFEYIVELLGKGPQSYISSFKWSHTDQGYNFWLVKYFKWNRYLDKWKRTH